MNWHAPLLLIAVVFSVIPAFAQDGQLGASGDFRVNDRPGTAPTVGSSGGPSLPPGAGMFRDSLGSRPPDEILKSIDKELGKGSFEKSESSSSRGILERERDLRSPSDKVFK